MAENSDITKRPPDPFVAARVNDPKARPPATLALVGLLGDSDRPGRRRLYLNTRLDYWVEFHSEDVLAVEDVGPGQAPFQGLDATRVTLVRDAQVDYVRSRLAGGDDPFALQPLAAGFQPRFFAETWEAECPGPTRDGCPTDIGCPTAFECPSGWTVCKPRTCRETQFQTCDTCDTCGGRTCQTCQQDTCGTCGENTCVTCGGATCVTCPTGCAATCGPTCVNTCVATCGNTCVNTCANTCAPTCFNTCGNTCGPTCFNTCRFTCNPDGCETIGRCPTVLQTHCNTCRC